MTTLAWATAILAQSGADEATRRHLQLVTDVAKRTSVAPSVTATVTQVRGLVAGIKGHHGRAAPLYSKASRYWQEAGNQRQFCLNQTYLATALRNLGQYQAAKKILVETRALALRLRADWLIGVTCIYLAASLVRLGELDAGEALLRQQIAENQTETARAAARCFLTEALLERCDLDGVLDQSGYALPILQAIPSLRIFMLALRARAFFGLGRIDQALREATTGMQLLYSLGGSEEGDGLIRVTHGEVLRAAGEHERARKAIVAARDCLLVRAAEIEIPAWRDSFLGAVAENCRTLELARAWLATRASRDTRLG